MPNATENWYIILYDLVSRLWYISTSGPFCMDGSHNDTFPSTYLQTTITHRRPALNFVTQLPFLNFTFVPDDPASSSGGYDCVNSDPCTGDITNYLYPHVDAGTYVTCGGQGCLIQVCSTVADLVFIETLQRCEYPPST